MQVTVFSTRPYDRDFLDAANVAAGERHNFRYLEAALSAQTVALAQGTPALCAFVNDRMDAPILEALHSAGIRLIALRSTGFNNVDLEAAGRLGITVARVPSYSPESIAEHSLTMILALNRKIHRAYVRVREGNFALDGLLGFELGRRTVGLVGTGRIGAALSRILHGFGCQIMAADPKPDEALRARGVRYVELAELWDGADIVSIHCPLTPTTRHLVDAEAIARMRDGVMLINTSRGAVIDTRAVVAGLKTGKIGALGLDVYEEEGDLFFRDLSDQMLKDDLFARLLTFPNVLITGHQGFFTREAMQAIAETTMGNLSAFEDGRPLHEVGIELMALGTTSAR